MWKKLTETNDIICYEKKKRDFKIRIEARYNNKSWYIYKTYFTDKKVDFVEEYATDSKREARAVIKNLLKEKDLTHDEMKEYKKMKKEKCGIKFERAYKEYEVEKWFFSVNGDPKINFVTVHFGEDIDMDIIMHEKYRFFEKMIIDELVRMLGINTFDIKINQNIYFFNKKNRYKARAMKRGTLVGKIEMNLGEVDG